ncbi:WAP four-disulfide core domain protein 3 [Hyperolius riggenbachi]|uniref:WAP four-disulfide core domain protein 3 n=1 Tax=Hyperolius riggenbachi TaxID=752182 RepID=UPI0035A337C1
MMRTEQTILLLGLLLSLCTLIISTSVKGPANEKSGQCPRERYYVKNANVSNGCLKLCKSDTNCPNNMMCCNDNCAKMCKPPAKEKAGQCPTLSAASATKCSDNCTSDSECPGNYKCCFKECGLSCVSPDGQPNTDIPAKNQFCKQESVYACALEERAFCDENSCTDGFKCCPFICHKQCTPALEAKAGRCPVSDTACPNDNNSSCTSDGGCPKFHKCCNTQCGMRCLREVNIPVNIHFPNNTFPIFSGRKR